MWQAEQAEKAAAIYQRVIRKEREEHPRGIARRHHIVPGSRQKTFKEALLSLGLQCALNGAVPWKSAYAARRWQNS